MSSSRQNKLPFGSGDAEKEIFDVDKFSRVARYTIALTATSTATAISLLLKTPLDHGAPPYFFFSVAILISAFLGGIGPGLVATFLSAIVSNFFFISPVHSFSVDHPEQLYRLTLFALEGVLISLLTAWLGSEKRDFLKSIWLRYAAAFGVVAAAVAIKLPLYPRLEADVPFVMFYAAVMFTAWAGGLGPGLLATALAALAADYFFTEPYYNLKIDNANHAVRVGLFLIEGSLISYFSTRAYAARQAAIAARGEKIAALLESERRYRYLVERAADIITVFDATGIVLYVSPATTRLTGFAPEEVIGRNTIEDFVHPADRERVWQTFKQGLAENRLTGTVEYRHRLKNGGWRVFESTGSNLVDDPTIGGIVVNTRDINEYTEKIELLRDSEERFRLAVRATNDAVWEWNLETGEVWRSENYGELFNHSPNEIAVNIEWWFTHIHPADRERVRSKINQTFHSNAEIWRDEYRFERGGNKGKKFNNKTSETHFSDVSDKGYIVRDKAGKAIRFIGAISDISESKAAESWRARLASIVESSPDGIKILDRNGIILSCNRGATELFGYPEKEIIGNHCELFLPQENRDVSAPALREMLERVYAGETIVDVEMTGQRKDGSLIEVAVTLSPIKTITNEVTGIAAVNRNITPRKQTEAALFETQEQLRQAQKMEAIGRLAGGVAHDFNNMLSIINGYSEIALQKISENDQTRRYLEEIERAGTRAAVLTRQLLAFSRKQLLQPRVVNLNEIVCSTEEMLKRLIGSHLRLQTELTSGEIWLTVVDGGQIEQAIINLVANARDAMPEGGTIKIGTQNISLDKEKSSLSMGFAAVPAGEYISLFVSDTGMGMNEVTKNKIFEPFFTTKEMGQGTGLGLSTVYGIVKQSNGYITVESNPNAGSTFRIYLPRASSDRDFETDSNIVATPTFIDGTETILIVEDEEALREVMTEFLSEIGYTVLAAADGEAGLEICQQTVQEIALVVTDLQMPGMSGREFADRVSTIQPQLQVLFMSGFTNDPEFHQSAAELTVRFIQKPFALNDLAQCIRNILDAD